jgi:hypothetical protein
MRKVIDLQAVEEVNDEAMHKSGISLLGCIGANSDLSVFIC